MNFAGRITPAGEVFSHCLAEATAGIRSFNHFIRIAKSSKEAWACESYL